MKMKLLLILSILIVIGFIIFIFCFKNKIVEIDEFKYFEFGYSNGYAMNSNILYRVDCNDKCIAKIKPYGVEDSDAFIVELNDNEVSKIISILKKYNVSSWNGFNKTNKNVLDGDSFHMYLSMKNGDYISASGYMKWPNNYSDVRGELDNLFSKLIVDNDN